MACFAVRTGLVIDFVACLSKNPDPKGHGREADTHRNNKATRTDGLLCGAYGTRNRLCRLP